jgi:hypothetical protein
MLNRINIVALVAGISTLILIAISLFVPWWQFIVGNPTVGNPAIATVNVSPVNVNLALLGDSFTVPLIYALNIASALTLASGGITMLIYSLRPNKSYSMKLLGFGYKKPLYALIIFVITLVAMSFIVQKISGFTFPLIGSGATSLPRNMLPDGANVSFNVSAAFGWPFYFAIVVAGMCVAARFYHRKVVAIDATVPPQPAPQ